MTQKYLENCYDSKYSTQMNLLIDEDIVKTFMPYLNPNEQIVWTAKPSQGFVFNVSDIPAMLFATFWLFMCSNLFTQLSNQPETFDSGFIIMPIVFICIGLYLLIGHFFVSMFRRSKIVYAMSNQRIFIRSGIVSNNLNIITMKNIETIKLKEKSQGDGTIELDKIPKYTVFKKRNLVAEMAGYFPIPRIENIEKVQEVYILIGRFQEEGVANK